MNRKTAFLAMIGAHALADYPLQGDFLAKGKIRNTPIPGCPWWQPLSTHAAIHGLFVGIVTKRPMLGAADAIIHAVTDDAKCQGRISYNQDQAIHIACKAVWAMLSKDKSE